MEQGQERLTKTCGALLQAGNADGAWQAPARRPRSRVELTKHRVIYTCQVLRALAEAGFADEEMHKLGAAYLTGATCGVPLFDVALKIPSLHLTGLEEHSVDLALQLLRRIDASTGWLELGRRRQGPVFEALFALEAILIADPSLELPAAQKKSESLLAFLHGLARQGYMIGPAVSLWAWYLVIRKRLGKSIGKRLVETFARDIYRRRGANGIWSPPALTERPTTTPEIHGDLMETAHVVLNVVELEESIPTDLLDELLVAPVTWILQQYSEPESAWRGASGKSDPYLTALCLRVMLRSAVLSGSERCKERAIAWLGKAAYDAVAKNVGVSITRGGKLAMNRRVFIIHGHDGEAKNGLARLLDKEFGLESIILHEQPSYGSATIIEKLEEVAGFCEAAFVLLTPDDKVAAPEDGHDDKLRARQNVVFEMGYFIAKLGRDRVFLLHKGDVEIPSDASGILYIPFDRIEDTYLSIKRELEGLGLT